MKKILAVVLLLSTVLTFTGCNAFDIIGSFTSYWDGMTKNETMEYVQDNLHQKYGEQFKVKKIALRNGSSWDANPILLASCSPLSDESIIFQIEVNVFGKDENKRRFMDDTYIQSIVGREMRTKAEEVLSQYTNNFAVEVYVWGLTSNFDSGIRSSDKATIENFTNAIPNENGSTIWIAFDINEFNSDYEKTENYVKEIIDEFYLTNGIFKCYFVSSDIVEDCKEKIVKNHADYSYDMIGNMEVTLSTYRPIYTYHFKGNDEEIYPSIYL